MHLGVLASNQFVKDPVLYRSRYALFVALSLANVFEQDVGDFSLYCADYGVRRILSWEHLLLVRFRIFFKHQFKALLGHSQSALEEFLPMSLPLDSGEHLLLVLGHSQSALGSFSPCRYLWIVGNNDLIAVFVREQEDRELVVSHYNSFG